MIFQNINTGILIVVFFSQASWIGPHGPDPHLVGTPKPVMKEEDYGKQNKDT